MPFILPGFLLDIPRNPILAIGIPLALGSLSGFPTRKVAKSNWYKTLATPPGRPPRQIFPIVWTTLYAAMGWASYLAVKTYDTTLLPEVKSAAYHGLKLYWIQLGLNLIWTPLFFGVKQLGLATIDSVLLATFTGYMTIVLDKATDGATSWFLVPYCAWLSFATYLTGGIWLKNRKGNSGGPKKSA
ncbi:hypothetical protein M422DRAFT_218667 [Sphaerobolus stellatus SS14]|nr:hypothetical protein M422DRAFT_218667 [Sphaerobolus stellatus SS14]